MGIEIERKFLPKNDDWRNFATDPATIRQGYLAREYGNVVRVRITDIEGTTTSQLCIKGLKQGGEIPEYEVSIPHDMALELFKLCEWSIKKIRRHVYAGDHTFEIDEFAGNLRGLVVIEVELGSVGEQVDLPDWIGKEITDDPRYNNAHLCEHGVPG
ncbi:MAG: CYTH domain-containing protein [Candidatus Paceibacterota bacterium]